MISIDKLPVHVGLLLPTAAEARNMATGRISLTYCHCCSFVYNRHYEPGKLVFEPGYEASLAHTATFRDYVRDLVERLVSRYGLRDKSVLEIGCGDGYFLQQLCRFGSNDGVGIDPTVKQERTEHAGDSKIHFIADYFSAQYQHLIADFICSMSVFETMPDPRRFLADLHEMIGDRDDVTLYFEVPNSTYMFDREATWSIYYEQFGHFTPATLSGLFERCGYDVLDAGSCYEDGQYTYVEARHRKSRTPGTEPAAADRTDTPATLKSFADAHEANVRLWRKNLEELSGAGKKVIAWGSGGKGNSFLNLLGTEDLIRYVVDINPDRHGRFIPGSAQEIVAPEFTTEYRPDVIIITNPIYEREIRQQVADLGVTCEFMAI